MKTQNQTAIIAALASRVCEKLGITSEDFQQLFVRGGYGPHVINDICARFRIDRYSENGGDWADVLDDSGILSRAENLLLSGADDDIVIDELTPRELVDLEHEVLLTA